MSERIATKCPACHSSTLMIGDGNWLVCSLIGCPDPTRINSVGDRADNHFSDVQALRDERDRLARRVKDLEGRFKLVGKYMANGRIQQAHDLAKDTVVAMYMTEAAMTPAGQRWTRRKEA